MLDGLSKIRGTKIKTTFTIAGLVISFVGIPNAWLLERSRNAAEQRLVDRQKMSAMAQRKADEDLAYDCLARLLTQNSVVSNAQVLELIAELSPSRFDQAAKLESVRGSNASPVRQIAQLQAESKERSIVFDFNMELATARQYIPLVPAGQVAGIFRKLATNIPASREAEIDHESLQSAEAGFKKGDFKIASDEFQRAFRNLKVR